MSNFTIERRQFFVGALLAPLVSQFAAAIGFTQLPCNSTAITKARDGTMFISVPKEWFEFMFLRGWECCPGKNGKIIESDGLILMKRPPL